VSPIAVLDLGLAVGGLFALGLLIWLIRKSGANAEKLKEEETDAEAARRIADAQVRSPRDPDDLVGRLRNGGKL
jgi:hypothetical protein